ncbi:MAG: thioredoxin domain-containing protein [Bifidobacteriaceae bacterium]|jgi:protein-disulfide isomerase|nr:thioredoxin domain-containing protein [Bifidobacteriaceae bacterium]
MISIPGITIGARGVAEDASLPDQPLMPARVDVFLDYMCPYCRQFDQQNGPDLQEMVNRGLTAWVIHPLAFLDRLSQGSAYSTRSAAAAYAVAQGAPEHFGAFNALLFNNQPKEGTAGLSGARLEGLAQELGVSQEVTKTFATAAFFSVVQASTQVAIDAGVQGTPTVLLSSPGAGTYQWDGSTSIVDALEVMTRA